MGGDLCRYGHESNRGIVTPKCLERKGGFGWSVGRQRDNHGATQTEMRHAEALRLVRCGIGRCGLPKVSAYAGTNGRFSEDVPMGNRRRQQLSRLWKKGGNLWAGMESNKAIERLFYFVPPVVTSPFCPSFGQPQIFLIPSPSKLSLSWPRPKAGPFHLKVGSRK